MFFELEVLDGYRGVPVWAQVEVDLTTLRWSTQEGGALEMLTFDSSGTVQRSGNELRLMGSYRKAGDRALVLQDAPSDDQDQAHTSGSGRIEGHVSMAYQNAKIKWNVPALARIRQTILSVVAAIFPPFPQLLTPGESPMNQITSNKFAGIPGETNCYAFPGYVARQLGSTVTHAILENLPDMRNPGKYKMQNVTLSITKGIMALEKLASAPHIGAWVPFTGKNRPNPGDFYVLASDSALTQIQHVGVIIDAVGSLWLTADSGQGAEKRVPDKDDPKQWVKKWDKGMQAGYRQRSFENGILTGEFGKAAYLKGWVNIDNAVLFPNHATRVNA